MPEYPDIQLYLHALRPRVVDHELERIDVVSPFLLRSVDPPLRAAHGQLVVDLHHIGKRIVFELQGELFLVVHLMISGRFRWKEPGFKVPRKRGLAAFRFAHGTLLLTEASPRKRASLHVVRGREGLNDHDPGGLELFEATLEEFAARLREENHTLKRTLTNPTLFSGVGNAYSDEVLHRARLSPFLQSQKMDDAQIARLFEATREVLAEWAERLVDETGDRFPEKVTAFRPEMAVHGKYGEPCPVCGAPVQRIVYASNETNYCPTCQTGGKLLADRSLSRLLKKDWPRTPEELEAKMRGLRE